MSTVLKLVWPSLGRLRFSHRVEPLRKQAVVRPCPGPVGLGVLVAQLLLVREVRDRVPAADPSENGLPWVTCGARLNLSLARLSLAKPKLSLDLAEPRLPVKKGGDVPGDAHRVISNFRAGRRCA